jgi:hypothetical protein
LTYKANAKLTTTLNTSDCGHLNEVTLDRKFLGIGINGIKDDCKTKATTDDLDLNTSIMMHW